jgi:SAM-dependent methyltransferase
LAHSAGPNRAELAAVEILSVSRPDEKPEQLWGSNIDSPAAGFQTDRPELHVSAWAIGQSAPAAALELVSEDQVLAVAPLRTPRPDLSAAYSQVPEAGLSGMAVDLDTSELPQEFEIMLRVVLQTGERVQIGSIAGRRGDPSDIPRVVAAAPSLKKEVRDLLQSLAPDGFNEPESEETILDRIMLRGEKVLDVGAGLGDTSRGARSRGAAIVDGFEPDAELVRLARLLNAYYHATRVSFYHCDIARPDTYDERYGVVLALSAFDRVGGALGKIAEITDGVLVTIVSDVEKDLASIGKSFENHEVLDAARGLVAAAHTKEALATALRSDGTVAQARQ